MKNWQNVELLTRLATEEEIAQNNLPVFKNVLINKNDAIQFYLKIISTEPDDFPSHDPFSKMIACFSTHISAEYFHDQKEKSNEERIEAFLKFIDDKILTVKITERDDLDDPSKSYYNANLQQIISVSEDVHKHSSYSPSPLFKSDEISFEDLLKKLETRQYLKPSRFLSKEDMDCPEYIYYENEYINDEGEECLDITVIGAISSFEQPLEDNKYCKYNFDGSIKYTKLEEDDYRNLVKSKNNILYVTADLMGKIDNKLRTTSNIIHIGESDEDIQNKEADFINHLFNTLEEKKLIYDHKDIVNFHTAMKTSNLVILSGMSGTGKSQLVRSYAESLGLKDEFKFISVNPSWTDDSDIIGFADTLNMVYKPDDNGLIESLVLASKSPQKLFVICFDEMNLARIEHYFSQFLSLLESDESNRVLRLYSKELEGRLYNSEKYKPSIKIGQNVRFVGTVNIDDSTHHFSDKVLDRANLISLSVMPFADLAKITRDEKENLQTDEDFANLYAESFMNRDKQIELDDITIEFLQRLHDLLSEIGKQTGIGPRIVRQIDSYMKNIPKKVEILESAEALDLQVVQRILSKLRGSQEQLEDIIGQYDHSSNAVKNSRLIELLDAFTMISEFKSSKKLISDKVKELELHGYTF